MHKRLLTNIIYPNITITLNAWEKFDNIIKNSKSDKNSKSNKNNIKGFLFSAKSGGCNGFNYNLRSLNLREYDSYLYKNSKYVPVTVIRNNNIGIMIDPISEAFLIGTTIDYINADYKNNNFENKFIYLPNKSLASSCGCGKSFTVNDE